MALTISSVSKVQSNPMTFYLALQAFSGHVRLAYDTGVWILTCWCLSERWYEVCVHSWVFLFLSLPLHIVFVLLESSRCEADGSRSARAAYEFDVQNVGWCRRVGWLQLVTEGFGPGSKV